MGRRSKLPPQFGQTPASFSCTHVVQKVHSNVQIMASVDSGGKSVLQDSQLGRNSSMRASGVTAGQAFAEYTECTGLHTCLVTRRTFVGQHDFALTL